MQDRHQRGVGRIQSDRLQDPVDEPLQRPAVEREQRRRGVAAGRDDRVGVDGRQFGPEVGPAVRPLLGRGFAVRSVAVAGETLHRVRDVRIGMARRREQLADPPTRMPRGVGLPGPIAAAPPLCVGVARSRCLPDHEHRRVAVAGAPRDPFAARHEVRTPRTPGVEDVPAVRIRRLRHPRRGYAASTASTAAATIGATDTELTSRSTVSVPTIRSIPARSSFSRALPASSG